MTYYKWMLPRNEELITPTQGHPWPVKVGEWTAKKTPFLCESGWHGVKEKDVLEHLPSQIGAQLWVVETKGALVEGDDKFAAAQMRLVRLIGTTTEENLRLFACDVAQDVLPLFEKKYPKDTRPRHAIEVARRFANGDATLYELNAAEDAAGTAAGYAARAAGYAARAAAWVAAWDVRAAAEAAARDAGDAAWATRAAARERYSNWLVVRIESGY